MADLFVGQRLGIEFDAFAAVDLRVAKRGGDPGQISGIGGWFDARDFTVLAVDGERLGGAVVACTEIHNGDIEVLQPQESSPSNAFINNPAKCTNSPNSV
jgi:hypothetical protein